MGMRAASWRLSIDLLLAVRVIAGKEERMEPEAQIKGLDDRAELEGPPVLDLNQATVEDLQTLGGIGPALAQRIVAYRAEQGGFGSPEELTAVPGVGRAAYERLADRLTAVPIELPTPPPAEEAVVAEEAAVAEAPQVALVVPEPPEMEELPPPAAEKVELEEEPLPEVEAARAEEPPPPPVAEPVAPAPPRAPARRPRFISWLLTALMGGLLGMALALLVFYGINGALDLRASHAALALQSQVDGLEAEIEFLRGEIGGLDQRLGALEGLTAEIKTLKTAVEALDTETADLDQRTSTLEGELESVTEDLAEVQGQAQQVTTFFGQLQTLLRDVFGDETAVEPAPESPVETPTPTE
jgi:competence ComEA-like helix-hairpin-helix protein